MKKTRLLAAVVVAVLLAACSSSSKSTSSGSSSSSVALTQGSDIKIEVVTHGQASDPFWSVVKNGVDQAAKDQGVTVNYSAPDTFDMVKMAQLIDAAVAKKPIGLIVSLPDYPALKGSLQKAKDAGIAIITINSGSDHYLDVGAITHIGQDEAIAGEGAGKKLADAGVKKLICINQEVGNAGLDARCNGAKKAITAAGGTLEVLQVDLKDAAGAQNTIKAKIQSDSSVDGILALGPTGSAPALAALKELGQNGKTKLATFDLSPVVLDAITAGDMLFAVDQQQYVQGYLGVTAMALYAKNLNTVGGGLPINTGPGFVTKDTAAKVKDLAAKGTR
jgi:simple sugar transport system substrate-binding protein